MEFSSIEDWIAHLELVAGMVPAAGADGLESGAKFVEKHARAALGHYQDGAGPFPAWAPLADDTVHERSFWGYPGDEPERVTNELANHIEHRVDAVAMTAAIGVPSVTVGEHDSDHEDPHTRFRDIGQVALEQEMGLGHLPQRSFLGLTCAAHGEEIAHLIIAPVVAVLAGHAPINPTDDDIPF